MATKLSDITEINWQISTGASGTVAQGIDDIRQCVQIILLTTKGSDPLRPLFGSDIWRHIDKPVKVSAALISAEIIDCLGKWEARIIINKIIYEIKGEQIKFYLYLTLLQSGETAEISFNINSVRTPDESGRAFSSGFSLDFS